MLYIVSAWLLLQVFDVLISIAQLPEWVGTTVLMIVLTGFPISLLIAWFFELTPEGIRRETGDTFHDPAGARRIDFIIIGVLAAAVLVLVVDNYVLSKPGVPQQSVGKLDPRSIAVLPFSNSSAAAENADFFADGVHDDLLTQLAKLSGLKVISRTSVMEYRDTPKNMRQIGYELGAGSLLEGSVQRAGNSLRINAQLIDAQTDEHLWAETFDRELTPGNIFAIQSEIASSIATALHLTLSSEERTYLDYVPTSNMRAYDLFLKARAASRKAVTTRSSFEYALAMWAQVIEEDPDFALAHAERAYIQAKTYWWGFDPEKKHIEAARHSIERAMELNPSLPEARLSLGYYYYWSNRDYPRAMAEFLEAEKGMPGDHRVLMAQAYIKRRLGQMEASIANMKKAISINPRDGELHRQIAQTYELLRDFESAKAHYQQGLELSPELVSLYMGLGFLDIYRDANTEYLKTLSQNPPVEMAGSELYAGWVAARIDGDTDVAIDFLDKFEGDHLEDQWVYWPISFVKAYTYMLADRTGQAESLFRESLRWLEQYVDERPDDARPLAALGTAHAFLGNAERAMVAFERHDELVPYERDHFLGSVFKWNSLMILAVLQDRKRLYAELDVYLSRPGYFSAEAISRLPRFAAFREDPEFLEVVDRYRSAHPVRIGIGN